MTKRVLIWFTRALTRPELGSYRHAGPVFHRWLPDGKTDALVVNEAETDLSVQLWFERFGVVKGSFIVFDKKRRGVDPDVMRRQGALDAGLLHGEAAMRVSAKEWECVTQDSRGSLEYEAVGKRFVKSVLHAHAIRFIRVLRWTYGQYWLSLPATWDSREMSLGSYCKGWNAHWSEDRRGWTQFVPNELKHHDPPMVQGGEFREEELLNETDWSDLQVLLRSGYDAPRVAELISRAHELADQQQHYAFVEAVAATEAMIEHFFSGHAASEKPIEQAMESFWGLPLRAKLAAIALSYGQGDARIAAADLASALRAIETRNRLVHEGVLPPVEEYGTVRALLRVASHLAGGPRFRFPRSNQGNMVLTRAEDWSKRKRNGE